MSVTAAEFPRKFGKYYLLGPLAQGGMGALYIAATGERGLERLLVVKTVLPHLADAEYLARFRDEAKVVVKLSHPNLVPVFDAGKVDGELFLAMEFVEGKDLRAVWNRCAQKGVAFPIDVAAFVVRELCRGLHYAHSYEGLELVHRDVSPPNVLVSYAGEVKLTDFGLAASTLKLEKTAPGIIYGKVAYMSPEQARGDKLDGRSDLYAAGIILWELLTGRQLFPPGADQPQELLKRARDPEVMSPSQRAPRVPAALDDIVTRALTPSASDRYASCAEFQIALSNWLATEAPHCDSARVEKFLAPLFATDIDSEREQRSVLLDKIQERAKTLPPSDELRRMVETGAFPFSQDRRDRPRGKGGDRRRGLDRRNDSDPLQRTFHGMAVDPEVSESGSHRASIPVSASPAAATAALSAPQPMPATTDFVGQLIDDRYQIEKLLGEGGMGRVYLAEHIQIGKQVALKVLHPVYGRMPDLVERFRREARAASKIGNPHIVDVTDSGTTADGSVYFVMEYLDGMELAAVIAEAGSLDITRALRVAVQIARALKAAHDKGIIHRDLKPENIFLTEREGVRDFVKVLDFGIAKSLEGEEARAKKLTSPGMAMGTPEYMAPEQAAGRPADVRSDVYSLGAILFEMLSGEPPYQGDNFMEILTKKATIDPPPVRSLRSEVPDAVERVIHHAMARQPDARPASMERLEYELTKCMSGQGVAVAHMLGVSADPQLLASLNPGLEVRPGGIEAALDDSYGGPGLGLAPGRGGSQPLVIEPQAARTQPLPDQLASVDSGAVNFDDTEVTPLPDMSPHIQRAISAERSEVPSRMGLIWKAAAILLAGVVVATLAIILMRDKGTDRPVAVVVPDSGLVTALPDAALVSSPKDAAAASKMPDAAPLDAAASLAKRSKKSKKPYRRNILKNLDEANSALIRAKRRRRKGLPTLTKLTKYYGPSRNRVRSRAYLAIAQVQFEAKSVESALRAAKNADKLGAGVPAYRMLGRCYLRLKNGPAALKQWNRLLKRIPSDREALKESAKARAMTR